MHQYLTPLPIYILTDKLNSQSDNSNRSEVSSLNGCDVSVVVDGVVGCHYDDRRHVAAAGSRWRQRRLGSHPEHDIMPWRNHRGAEKFIRQETEVLPSESPPIDVINFLLSLCGYPAWHIQCGSTLCSEKKQPLLFSCITLRKRNQFEWKFQTK